MPAVDTKDWKLTALLDYKCKVEPISHDCPACHGNGMVGGGFKSLDDPSPCHGCGGTGGWLTYDHIEPKPEVPDKLVQHLRKAYQEYIAMEGV